ncbi:MAG: ribosome biogenesis GTPase YlqF [Clostridia bacterium]|nr:ribosome biogenesis GTPase YlqF [Clostridia bacterium]
MEIQWYPGHMTKAFRMMENEIKIVDAIIYVLDSRAPFSCVNPKFATLVGDKPIIYVFNKSDIADRNKVYDWVSYFSKFKNSKCLVLDSTMSGSASKIENLIMELAKSKIEKYKQKNINILLRAMVIGVPNSGKSTLINNLCGKAKTLTGNRPGVTKGKQWVKISNLLEILDTPGTLWPSFDNDIVAHHLAYIGSIKEEILDINELAFDFIKEMMEMDKSYIENRYNIEIYEDMEPLEVLDAICEARKFVLKGNELDYDRCCKAIITDFKQGRLGNITLESVKDVNKLTKKTKVAKESKN